jgi:hypothetical protein
MATTKQRKICVYCGCKKVIDKMEFVGIRHGSYFQADKEISGYVCIETCLVNYNEKDRKFSPYHDPVK